MKTKQDITIKNLRRKFRTFWTKTERSTDGYRSLIKQYDFELLVDEARQMQLWCAKRNKKSSLLRFYRWMKNQKKWNHEKHKDDNNLEQDEREKTREYLNKYRDDPR